MNEKEWKEWKEAQVIVFEPSNPIPMIPTNAVMPLGEHGRFIFLQRRKEKNHMDEMLKELENLFYDCSFFPFHYTDKKDEEK